MNEKEITFDYALCFKVKTKWKFRTIKRIRQIAMKRRIIKRVDPARGTGRFPCKHKALCFDQKTGSLVRQYSGPMCLVGPLPI